MSVVGIDFGSFKTVIAIARRGNVDIIVNEVSNRSTPSMVSFGPKCRYLGESAKTQEVSNYSNTISCIKRFVGRCYSEPEISLIEENYLGAKLVDINGKVGMKVQFLGKEQQFTAVQIAAMYFTKIKQTIQNENITAIPDVVISVPAWFTDAQRWGILNAAEIAGLNTLRIINDTTAAALSYGIIKTDLPEDKTHNICIIDIGHSDYSVSIVAFKKGQLTVKSSACDPHFGGRDFDKILMDYFISEFINKYKIDVTRNTKAKHRLMVAIEKLRKNLSANTVALLNIESLMNNVDVSCMLSRENMEKMSAKLLDRVLCPLKEVLENAGMTVADIDSIEMIGGCTRIPCLKEKISAFFGKPLSFTLNQDEAVARGCAFACAILSPVFKVRDFSISDILSYPIKFSWEPVVGVPDEETNFIVFPKNNVVPSTKILTFYRKEPFTVEASYASSSSLPGHVNSCIARYHIKNVTCDANNQFSIVKLRVRVNLHGLLSLEQAYVVEEQEIQEAVSKDETSDKNVKNEEKVNGVASSELMDVETEKPETRKIKKLLKKCDLSFVTENFSLDLAALKSLKEAENEMISEDKIVAITENQKNALEEYIYDMRSKLCDVYADYASNDEKLALERVLNDAEEWLYDEGEDTTKMMYQKKLEDLMKVASPIVQRKFDADEIKRKEQIAMEEQKAAERAELERLEREKAEKDANMESKENHNFTPLNEESKEKDNIDTPSVYDTEMVDSL